MAAAPLTKVIGFSVLLDGEEDERRRFLAEHDKVLGRFPWLTVHRLAAADARTTALVWGFGDVAALVRTTADGPTVLFATGVRHDALHWPDVEALLAKHAGREAELRIPWEGIVNLVRVGPGGVQVWNDWTGACKVYAACEPRLACVSTLEPVVYRTTLPGRDRIAPASVYALMTSGHFFGDATLYADIRVQPPDTHATYAPGRRRVARCGTIGPSDARWASGWDELVEEWGTQLEEAIGAGLGGSRPLTLMLSGGIDSRVIAAVAVRRGIPVEPVCYGNRTWGDTQFALGIARALGLDLRVVPIGGDYLRDFTRPWCEWFGASMCVHGMYQYPGLLDVRGHGAPREIVSGFTGDPLEGMQVAAMAGGPAGAPHLDRFHRKLRFWQDAEVRALVPWLDVAGARAEVEQDLQDQYAALSGAPFQRIWLLFQWNHVAQFSSYLPTMYEYFGGAVSPFVSRALADFCLSLPRVALEKRRLFYDVIRARFPELARLPGTYDHPSPAFDFIPTKYGVPLLLTKRYLAKAAVGYLLPYRWRVGPFREFGPTPNRFAQDAIAAHGMGSLFPLEEVEVRGQDLFDRAALERAVGAVLTERVDIYPQMRLWPIQTLLHRLAVAP